MDREEYKKLKIGDIVYKITDIGVVKLKIEKKVGYYNTLNNGTRMQIPCNKSKVFFTSKEDAEKKYNENIKIKEKKNKLYEYEKKLNEELGTKGYIIKI
jgi:hypothetical protein